MDFIDSIGIENNGSLMRFSFFAMSTIRRSWRDSLAKQESRWVSTLKNLCIRHFLPGGCRYIIDSNRTFSKLYVPLYSKLLFNVGRVPNCKYGATLEDSSSS